MLCRFQMNPALEGNSDVQDFVLLDACRRMLNNTYRMRIQNEDARLAADVKRDAALDRWRKLYESLRLSILHVDRAMLLAACGRLFRTFLPELLQARRVHSGADSQEVADAGDAGSPGLVAAVDCSRHPREWKLKAIAALLDEVVNTSVLSGGEWYLC